MALNRKKQEQLRKSTRTASKKNSSRRSKKKLTSQSNRKQLTNNVGAPSKNEDSIIGLVKDQLGEYGENFSTEAVYDLAKNVKMSDVHDEDKLRRLIYQVSKTFKVPVKDSVVDDLAKTISKTDFSQLGGLIESMLGKR